MTFCKRLSVLTVCSTIWFLPGAASISAQAAASDVKCNGCVNGSDVAKNAIGSGKIKNGSVRPADLAASAKPSGVDFADGNQSLTLGSTASVVRSTIVTAPEDGLLVAMASGTVSLYPSSSLVCSLTLGTTIDSAHEISAVVSSGVAIAVPIAGVRVFEVDKGNWTVRLVCRELGGAVTVVDSVVSAFYVPNRY